VLFAVARHRRPGFVPAIPSPFFLFWRRFDVTRGQLSTTLVLTTA